MDHSPGPDEALRARAFELTDEDGTVRARLGFGPGGSLSLDLADVAPLAQPLPLKNVLRDDVVQPGLDRNEVLAVAPAAEDGRFRVPPTIGFQE